MATRQGDDGDAVRHSSARPDAVVAVRTEEPVVGVGIDDGPDPEFTPRALEVLARHGARATFFVVGEQARSHPDLVQAIAAAGHEVGLHTHGHDDLVGLTGEQITADIDATAAAVRDAGVEPVMLLRPPRGRQDVAAAEAACRADVRTIGWTAWVSHLVSGQRLAPGRGDIVLAHDGRLDRADELDDLDRVLAGLGDVGLSGVGVGELLADR